MRASCRLLLLLLLFLAARPACGDDEPAPTASAPAALVRDLLAEDPGKRAIAETALRRCGTAALPALRAARAQAAGAAEERLVRVIGRIAEDWHRAKVPGGMVYVPAGQLEVPRERSPWGPSGQRVAVGAFYIDRTEVTVKAWRAYLAWRRKKGASEEALRGLWVPPADMADDLPAVRVNQPQAALFATTFRGGRLPRAEEYERALRGSGVSDWPWGAEPPKGRANLRDLGPGAPLPVASLPAGASGFGVQDLVGNVAEWSSTTIRQGQRGRPPLLLGGSFQDRAGTALTWRGLDRMQARVGERQKLAHVGFRVVRDVAPLP